MNIEEILEALLDESKESYDHYGLPVYKIGGAEYAIARDDEEAEEACKEYIKQSVWAFNASFLASHIPALDYLVCSIERWVVKPNYAICHFRFVLSLAIKKLPARPLLRLRTHYI